MMQQRGISSQRDVGHRVVDVDEIDVDGRIAYVVDRHRARLDVRLDTMPGPWQWPSPGERWIIGKAFGDEWSFLWAVTDVSPAPVARRYVEVKTATVDGQIQFINPVGHRDIVVAFYATAPVTDTRVEPTLTQVTDEFIRIESADVVDGLDYRAVVVG